MLLEPYEIFKLVDFRNIIWLLLLTPLLTLHAPTPKNDQTHSENSSPVVDD